ncbi:phosphoglycolate phosphatase [Acuticoccus sediminis]|uniref:phosphoglycolate phosphatase n=1 Tax=Acuticoccus sediminis TaxID=2184697 RepID=UPI001CFE3B84|nr:phosphoglycolate phosphatase [Acuticoccus sediminis]
MQPEPRTFGTVVFDLDGTLIDSAPALQGIASRFLAELDAAPLTIEETRSFIGNGGWRFCQRALESRGFPSDDDAVDAHYVRFLKIYSAAPASDNVLFPGVPEALSRLRDAGIAIGLCTNKPEAPTHVVLEAFGLSFDVVVTGDTLPQNKPAPEPLMAAIEALGGTARHTLYVGDSEIDALTAEAVGCPFALHTAGYHDTFEMAGPPTYRIDDIPALLGIVLARDAASA